MGRIAESIAVSAGGVSRRLRLGGGTSIGGMVLNRLEPGAMRRLAAGLSQGCVVISGTNGKTTTARMLRACLRANGRSVTANVAGANLASGVTTALLAASRYGERGELGVFEVDEAALDEVVSGLRPRLVLLLNLFRDQLDRYGEMEVLAERWGRLVTSLEEETAVLANVDDPAIAHMAKGRPNTFLFGLDADCGELGRELSHAADVLRCRVCGEALRHDFVSVGHLGGWACAACGTARPEPHFAATQLELRGFEGSSFSLLSNGETNEQRTSLTGRLQHPTPQETQPRPAWTSKDQPFEKASEGIQMSLALGGLHNIYNALAAASAARLLGVPAVAVTDGLASVDAAFGRSEQVSLEGRQVRLLLAKNPIGANENVHFALAEGHGLHLLVLLNDRIADGTDPSWIWDVDYEPLFSRMASLTLGGSRCWEMALRFRYGGIPPESFEVRERLSDALDAALSATPDGGVLWVLPTYTAMLEFRAELVRRGVARAFWEVG